MTQSDPPIQHRHTPTQYDLLNFAQHFTLPSTILSRKLLPIGNQTVVLGATKVDKSGQRERRGAEKLFLEAQRPLWSTLGCDVAAPALTWEGLFINQTAQPELHNTLPSLECQHKLEEKHLSCNYGGWWLVEMWTLFLVDRPFANHHQGSGRLITFNQPTNIQNCFFYVTVTSFFAQIYFWQQTQFAFHVCGLPNDHVGKNCLAICATCGLL